MHTRGKHRLVNFLVYLLSRLLAQNRQRILPVYHEILQASALLSRHYHLRLSSFQGPKSGHGVQSNQPANKREVLA